MLKQRTSVSPIQQMYVLNRIKGANSPGMSGFDPVSVAMVLKDAFGFFKKAFSFGFGPDPMRDVHIPAQKKAVDTFATILNNLQALRVQGRTDRATWQAAVNAVKATSDAFWNYTQELAAKHPDFAPRYRAGATEVRNLGNAIIADITKEINGMPTSIFNSVTSYANNLLSPFTGGNTQVSQMILAGAAFFFLPKLFKKG